MEKHCDICGKLYKARVPFQKYCCLGCRYQARNDGYTKHCSGLSPGTVGALSELKVATDLLEKGYEVFRSLSPACSCDLAVLKDGKLLRVEVTTGNLVGGKLYSPKTKGQEAYFDILAIVNGFNNEITYRGEF